MPTSRVNRPIIQSFPPIAAPGARVLILGTMPSIASLAKQQYYGHPRNAFWPIMGELFGAGADVPYDRRTKILREHGVAVWDVLQQCERPGSLDASICRESETANDLVGLLQKLPRIHTLFFNGTKAETAFRRHLHDEVAKLARPLRYQRLPSTSPAHAGRNFHEKLAAWRGVGHALSRPSHE